MSSFAALGAASRARARSRKPANVNTSATIESRIESCGPGMDNCEEAELRSAWTGEGARPYTSEAAITLSCRLQGRWAAAQIKVDRRGGVRAQLQTCGDYYYLIFSG